MDISLFDYELPSELIAQFPTRRRDQSRLMILDRKRDSLEIVPFRKVVDYINPGEALVVNNTRVFKARVFGTRATGAKVEIFLIRPEGKDLENCSRANSVCKWNAFVNPSRRVKEGERIFFGDYSLVLEQDIGGGMWVVRFNTVTERNKIIREYGHVPLPHYIKREDIPKDIRRYQTIFSEKSKTGAVAAPTAGFHFTRQIIQKLEEKDVRIIKVTLHVGPGTFKPVSAQNIEDHHVDPEFAELLPKAAGELNKVRRNGKEIFAVGTTTVRTLESALDVDGDLLPFTRMVDLYIRPGFQFKYVNHLLTNFHLPKSSLLILVAAFAGRERILEAYQEAIKQKMRFYSYGDAMLIL